MRRYVIALIFLATACVTTTSVTRTGTGLFAPREPAEEVEEVVPRGLSLSVASIAPDGTVLLDLRNYSQERFVFSGTPDRPALVMELQSGSTHSRQTMRPLRRGATHEVPAGERIQLKTTIAGARGSIRIGIRSSEVGFVVWTNWLAL